MYSYEANCDYAEVSREAGGLDISFELDTIEATKEALRAQIARLTEELETLELFGA